MYILAFDTSFERCQVSVSRNDLLLAISYNSSPFAHAETLIPLIESTLLKSNIKYQDLNYLAVIKGPGSFTGIRAGLAAAQAICTASGITPVTFSSFAVVEAAMRNRVKTRANAVVFKATESKVYIQLFDATGRAISEPANINLNEVVEFISGIEGPIGCAGNVINELYPLLPNVIFLPYYDVPNVRTIYRLAYEQIKSSTIDSELLPLYVAEPSARPKAH